MSECSGIPPQRLGMARRGLAGVALAVALVAVPSALRLHEAGAPAEPYARAHHRVSTGSTAAQRAFDRGLTLLYAFNRVAARRAFYAAIGADPRLAMAYWGIALSYGSNINIPPDVAGERAASAALARALALSRTASPSERDYIAALATRYSKVPKPDFTALAEGYHRAMHALARKYPDDDDAATLYAESAMDLRPWDLYDAHGRPRPGTTELCGVLESVLRRDPGHIGANHLYIHATEASHHPERALQAAGRLASRTFEPAAAHLVHMPAHTWARTGYYAEAAAANVLATAHDRAYLRTEGRGDPGLPPYHVTEATAYYIHDLSFLAFADEMDGNLAGSRGAMAALQAHGAHESALSVLLRFGRWQEILNLPKPKPDAGEPERLAYWHFARGMALAASGDPIGAAREHGVMNAAWHSSGTAQLADALLGARIALARHEMTSGLALLRSAVRSQDNLPYEEPPAWYYPVRESLGGALLRAGEPAAAARVFRDDLSRNPGNPRSLFGLAYALAASGDTAGARRVQHDFAATWTHADVPLSTRSL